MASSSHHRRRSSVQPKLHIDDPSSPSHSQQEQHYHPHPGLESGVRSSATDEPYASLSPYAAFAPARPSMSLSRSPSPRRGGGWSSPGLMTAPMTTTTSTTTTTSNPYYNNHNNHNNHNAGTSSSRRVSPVRVSSSSSTQGLWKSSSSSSGVRGGSVVFTPRSKGWAGHWRKISARLPLWDHGSASGGQQFARDRRKWGARDRRRGGRILPFVGRILWRLRVPIVIVILLILTLVYSTARKLFP